MVIRVKNRGRGKVNLRKIAQDINAKGIWYEEEIPAPVPTEKQELPVVQKPARGGRGLGSFIAAQKQKMELATC